MRSRLDKGRERRRSERRAIDQLTVLVVSVVLLFGVCLQAGSPSAMASGTGVVMRVSPTTSLFDQPLMITVSGVRSGMPVTIRVTSTDAHGVVFVSQATYTANARGDVNPARQAPISGSYAGIQAMGLIDFMAPAESTSPTVYRWSFSGSRTFDFIASNGTTTLASTSVHRRGAGPGVSSVSKDLSNTGFVGQYWEPPRGSHRRPAVVEFGGSEGGHGQLLGALLASHGYPTLSLGYFGEPGLPASLSNIPLEYFAHALSWLAARPGVDPKHIWVSGVSRGSEVALLLGALYPKQVYGVIASVPANVVLSTRTFDGPAWTLNGQALPYTRQFGNPNPSDNPSAVIPVERIRGPIFLDCAGMDHVWPSCQYASAITARLNARHDSRPHVYYAYPDAGHGIGAVLPYEPGAPVADAQSGFPSPLTGVRFSQLAGSTPAANPLALANLWPRLLAFLAKPITTH